MDKLQIIQKVFDEKIVAVIRAHSSDEARRIVEAVCKGNIHMIEITMTVPGALDIIRGLSKEHSNNSVITIGAGTVLDSETARACILEGASFVVTPCFAPEVIRCCHRYRCPVFPGAMTVSEAVQALEMGVDIVKIFPASEFGPSIIKAFKGPLPQAHFMPTGGVSAENAKEWLQAGAAALGVGGNLTKAENGNYSVITQKAHKLVQAVQGS